MLPMPTSQQDPPSSTKPDQPKGDGATTTPPRRTWGVFLLALLVNYLIFRLLFPAPDLGTVPYTVFKQQAAEQNQCPEQAGAHPHDGNGRAAPTGCNDGGGHEMRPR